MRRTVLDFSFAASMLKYKYVPINSTTTIYNRGTFVDELEKKLKKHSSLFYSPTANQKRVAEGFASYRAMNTLEQTKQHMFAYATKDNFVQKEGVQYSCGNACLVRKLNVITNKRTRGG